MPHGVSKEGPDAVHRLYYVAMTRARATLTLARMDTGNAMIDALGEHPSPSGFCRQARHQQQLASRYRQPARW
ncbi:MAG: hypothetical protein FWF12_11685 [Betaproteobacteria bacterium]|nr:hypothetical protein [Betaproteobacteria bacterium]